MNLHLSLVSLNKVFRTETRPQTNLPHPIPHTNTLLRVKTIDFTILRLVSSGPQEAQHIVLGFFRFRKPELRSKAS